MLLQHREFMEGPFGITPDSRYLYPSQTHREALASLKITQRAMGNATLLFRLPGGIQEAAQGVFLFDIDANYEPREFVAYLPRDIGFTSGHSSSEIHERLSEALAKWNRAGRKYCRHVSS